MLNIYKTKLYSGECFSLSSVVLKRIATQRAWLLEALREEKKRISLLWSLSSGAMRVNKLPLPVDVLKHGGELGDVVVLIAIVRENGVHAICRYCCQSARDHLDCVHIDKIVLRDCRNPGLEHCLHRVQRQRIA